MALHVHVGVPDPEDAVRVLNGLRASVPILIALSANSPFQAGHESGFCSTRTAVFGAFPRTGAPRRFESYQDYINSIGVLIASRAMPDPTFLWWDVRLQPALGTVEVRAMDAQTSAAEVPPLVALTQSLARLVLEGRLRDVAVAPEVLEENRFLAARDGLDARLIHPASGHLVPVRRLIQDLVEQCRPHAATLGCSADLERLGAGRPAAEHNGNAVGRARVGSRQLPPRWSSASAPHRDLPHPHLVPRKESLMCRWLAYSGSPILLERALYSPAHSLIDQSLHSRLGAEATNGDGFGVGWYDDQPAPGVFRSIEPAWNDQNLRELAGHVSSRLFFAHIRAAIGSAVQQTNCHPFRHGHWLFMHNGYIDQLHAVKRDLALAVDESLYPEIAGQADTELLFHLALTFGLEDDPPDAVARAIGLVEDVGHRKGVKHPFQGTIATTDGERVWAFRYSSEGKSRSLFFTGHVPTLRALYPDRAILYEVSDDARLIVSEPMGDLPGAWNEVPESCCGVVGQGDDHMRPFSVKPPARAVGVGV